MKRKLITDTQARFIAWVLTLQTLSVMAIFATIVNSWGASESARMQNRYVPSSSDKLLEGAFNALVSPYVLAKIGFPSDRVFAPLIFALNVALTGLLLLIMCVLFNVWNSRNREDKFASEEEISASARNS